MLAFGSSALAGLNKVQHKAAQRTQHLARAELEETALIKQFKADGIYDQYPVKPVPKDRSDELVVRFAGASKENMAYLDGSLPGDYGFDPLYLFVPDQGYLNPAWLRYAEVVQGRWAMLGVTGCIAPEILGALGVIPPETAVLWWKTGVIPPFGAEYEYWCEPWSLFWIEVLLMQFAELKRLQDFRNPGSQAKQWFLGLEGLFEGSGNQYEAAYPGGPFFNFAGLGEDNEENKRTLRTKEVNNGRLAMVSMLGYFSQAVMTNKGPFQNLVDHINDPWHNCLFGTAPGIPY